MKRPRGVSTKEDNCDVLREENAACDSPEKRRGLWELGHEQGFDLERL